MRREESKSDTLGIAHMEVWAEEEETIREPEEQTEIKKKKKKKTRSSHHVSAVKECD